MSLHDARKELRYLLNNGYKKKAALEFVSNHYGLSRSDRNILARTTYADEESAATVAKLAQPSALSGRDLAIDAYNVLITAEAVLFGDPLVCDDGVIRDDCESGGHYEITERTDEVLGALNTIFKRHRVASVTFHFDKNVSHSAEHAAHVSSHSWGVPVRTVLSGQVDHDLRTAKAVLVATGDYGIIQYLDAYVDIPRMLLFSW